MAPRIRLTLLTVLGLFALFTFFYVRSFVDPRPHGVILFVPEGLGVEMLQAGRVHAAGSQGRLTIEKLPHTGMASVHSSDNLVPDTASSATALSTGQKTPNGSIGYGSKDERLNNLLYTAQHRGRSTGLVTNSNITNPAPAAFYAYVQGVEMRAPIAAQFLDEAKVDILMGGGADYFLPADAEYRGARTDGRHLIREAKARGYSVIRDADTLESLTPWLNRRILGIFAENNFFYQADLEEWFPGSKRPTNQPRLADMVRRAIQLLEVDIGGYFLVVHSGLIAEAAEQNQAKRALVELAELDWAIQTALEFSGKRTTLVVASTHSCGGPKILASSGFSLDNREPSEDFWSRFVWVTGPAARPEDPALLPEWTAKQKLANSGPTLKPHLFPWSQQKALVYEPKGIPSAEDVIVAGRGPGTETLSGFLDNTDIFTIIQNQL